jgi:X-Pro dipeptidyl-peptidase-like protein
MRAVKTGHLVVRQLPILRLYVNSAAYPRYPPAREGEVEISQRAENQDGRVGMVGHSYPGSTPVVAAAQDPAGLVTIVPSAGLATVYDHQFQTGVPWAAQWLGPAEAYNELALIRALPPGLVPPEISPLVPVEDNTGENFGNDPEEAACGLTQSAFLTGESMLSGQEVGYHRERDWRAGAIAWDGNVFMVHGVNDNAARIPSMEWFYFEALVRRPAR